ncbi:hypothetical protein [Clostridium sp. D46t1_190503_E9]|uniref:hypothetical protein n=1 Tax=Clostridium sp. D46t1_190503_E9 TaxID=2787137 RepID=UPI00189A72AA|nr:hypothetical protein [Clostridium sp. D46t1_190503_E9]
MDTLKAMTNIYITNDYFNNNPYFGRVCTNKSLGLFYHAKIDNLNIIYSISRGFLQVTTSITKFMYNNNHVIFNFNDLSLFYKKMNLTLRFLFKGFPIKNFKDWNITRLDLASNYICSSAKDKSVYIEYFKSLKYSRANKTDYKTSVHANNKSICYNIYDKNVEAKNNNIYINDNILRVEFQFKNPYLYRKFKDIKTVDSILDNPILLNNLYSEKLSSLGLTINPQTTAALNNTLDTLNKSKKITSLLATNIKAFLNKTLKEPISSATIYQYKKILKTHNLNINTINGSIDKYIDFNNFQLFTTEYTNSLSQTLTLKYLRLLLLLLEEFIITNNYNIILENYYIYQSYMSIAFYDDS